MKEIHMKRCMANKFSRGYPIALGDGNKWWITGDEDLLDWVDTIGTIMELESGEPNGLPMLILSKIGDRDNPERRKIERWFPNLNSCGLDTGWLVNDYSPIRVWTHQSIPDIICEVKYHRGGKIKFLSMLWAFQPIYQRIIYKGGLPFHAGLVELAGRGILLAARANTGKSTCCRRLPRYWKVCSDDQTLIVSHKEKIYLAHPFPTWSEYILNLSANKWNIQDCIPLSAIFFLEQSIIDEVEPLGEGQAAGLINESTIQICHMYLEELNKKDQRKHREKIFNNVCKIARRVPAFRLKVSLHGRFWEKIEHTLGW